MAADLGALPGPRIRRGNGPGRGCGVAPCECGAGGGWGAALAAEALGTALLVLLGCAGGCGGAGAGGGALQPLVFPLVVLAMVQSFEHISGAFINPAMSLAGWAGGRLCARRAAAYSAAQLAGAAAGAGLLRALLPPGDPALALCVTRPQPHLALYKAVALEAVLTAALALANLASWDGRCAARRDSWPLRLALLVLGLSLAGGALTGASMNPARSLGPALLSADLRLHWVYWAGPLGGALAAALLHGRVWRAPAPAPARTTAASCTE